jgi:hypothetical protein
MSDPPVDQGRTDQRAASQNPIKHEQFHGMGQKGQARFAAIAIRTLQDLATANAATVESALKANGYSPGLTRITDWITQAQDLISDVSAAEVEPTTESSTTDETVVETRMSERPNQNQQDLGRLTATQTSQPTGLRLRHSR